MSYLRSYLTMSPLKVSAGYLIFGVVWIPATDVLIATLFRSQEMPSLPSLVKGWTFIGLSTVLIFGLSYIHSQQMATARTRLQTANQQLQVLHRVFRHNIRNDLNVIQGYADMLAERISEGESKSQLNVIQNTADKIVTTSEKLEVVEDVDPADGEAVDLAELVTAEVDGIRASYPEVTITTDIPDAAWIEGTDSIQRAVHEVLENAVVHNDGPNAEIWIRVDRTDGAIVLKISDNGPGISDEELRPLQTQEETPLVHASRVGLWLVVWLTRLHNGTVEFDTNGGTIVTFRFHSASRFPALFDGRSYS